MFDWPDAIQTSPTRMFLSMRVAPPFSVIVISAGSALAFRASSFSIHFPSSPALAFFSCPENFTVTSVPGLLQPQTGTAISRCRIALSEKGVPSSMVGFGASWANAPKVQSANVAAMALFNVLRVIMIFLPGF